MFHTLPPLNTILRTKWYIYIRWFVLSVIAVPGLLALYVDEGWSPDVKRGALFAAIALGSNAIFFILTRLIHSEKTFEYIALSILVFDILLITYFIAIKGGIESRSVILYVMPILMSAAIFGRKTVYFLSVSAVIAYDSLLLADYFNIIHTVGAFDPTLRTRLPYVIQSIIFFSSIFIILGAMVDFITKLLADQERLAQTNLAALKRAQAIAKLGSWEWDAKADTVRWSEVMYKIFGLNPNTTTATYDTFMGRIHPDDKKGVETELQKAMRRSKHFRLDHRIVLNNGTIRYIHTEGQSFLDGNHEVIRMIGTAQDITDAKILDEAKTDFVSLASHQLRTPASGVKQYLGMLLDGYAGPLTANQATMLQTAYDSNERQLRIVDDLLYVAQVDSGKMKIRPSNVDVAGLLKDILSEQAARFDKKGQQVRLSSRHKTLVCQADRQRLRMALENIIDNAHKYTPKGKKITVGLRKLPRYVSITVADQGVGIARQDRPRLFKKFSRIDNVMSATVGGSGLGLYWAARVIALHGGKIEIDSQEGRGTVFTILLPFRADKTPARARKTKSLAA
jgi:signal transduction histidine kinase